jgi:hypothetical protein
MLPIHHHNKHSLFSLQHLHYSLQLLTKDKSGQPKFCTQYIKLQNAQHPQYFSNSTSTFACNLHLDTTTATTFNFSSFQVVDLQYQDALLALHLPIPALPVFLNSNHTFHRNLHLLTQQQQPSTFQSLRLISVSRPSSCTPLTHTTSILSSAIPRPISISRSSS